LAELNKIVIKKYPNRRLYNTVTSQYITLEDIFSLIKNGDTVKVIDSKTSEDITRATLTQIILEQEIKGIPLLPTEFLEMIIKLYDHPAVESWHSSLQTFTSYWQQANNFPPVIGMPNFTDLANAPFDFAKTMEKFFNISTKNNDKS
jgi:polyhydroxyalkanoate synthesis repressor PhaR